MAANDSVRVRVTDLITKMLEYVRDGKRDANDVARVLQVVKDDPNFIHQLFPDQSADTPLKFSKRLKKQLKNWKILYRKEFNIDLDISKLRTPPYVPGLDFLIVVPKGLTLNQIVQVLRKHMKVWTYIEDLNAITSVRNTNETYAIWVRDRQEADEELKNKSANQLQQENVNCITLPERLLFHLKYFLETGKHLDEKNITLCVGSRCPVGGVPGVCWGSDYGEVDVGWFDPSDADSSLRARSVVS